MSLSVAGANILDCFGQQESGTDYNCGSNNDVKRKIYPPVENDSTMPFSPAWFDEYFPCLQETSCLA